MFCCSCKALSPSKPFPPCNPFASALSYSLALPLHRFISALHLPHSLKIPLHNARPQILHAIFLSARRHKHIQKSWHREGDEDGEHDEMREDEAEDVGRVVAQRVEFRVAER